MRCPVNSPLHAPASLPALPKNLDEGLLRIRDVPQVSAIKENVNQMFKNNVWHNRFKKLQNVGAEDILKTEDWESNLGPLPGGRRDTGMRKDLWAWRKRYHKRRNKQVVHYLDEEDQIDSHRAGASATIPALDSYLRLDESTRKDNRKKIRLRQAIALGSISLRTVYHRALEFQKAHNGGCSPSFGFSNSTARACIQEMKSVEWYRMLATLSEKEGEKKGWHVRTWHWRGFLIQYSAMGSRGPPIVLVHGFGAFWEHYRDNIKGLSDKGSRVWALTLLGFGRSEKPNVAYTELLWAELIRDFIVEVVGEPVTLVGNSIGGYMVSMVAGLWPQVVSNLFLLNMAGAIVPACLSLRYLKPREKSGVTWAASHLILLYMRGVSRCLLKKCYPVNPWRADDWLAGEVMRASFDPGAAVVLESLICWRKPLPINWFIDRYKDKVHVIQGFKDPLNRPTQRAQLLTVLCNSVTAKLLDAGHCPHDELPEEVNKLIMDRIQKSVHNSTDLILCVGKGEAAIAHLMSVP